MPPQPKQALTFPSRVPWTACEPVRRQFLPLSIKGQNSAYFNYNNINELINDRMKSYWLFASIKYSSLGKIIKLIMQTRNTKVEGQVGWQERSVS